ncbi:Hydroxymethylpyrimidine/phosphomethylpyrimidine kinase [Nitratireductor thuwali]|uniref:Hydroxymethylpyrimidine/phosphomethylpyrimidine kinase n=1 Tax=Nitratireductor thuwali TaxID=2267699 RepID=A0ABY5MCB6_9HYPH|nr:Hydroxymethylpyrimidine/phosphomethylpyrimidine kinase [Nitratireductor thuwali]
MADGDRAMAMKGDRHVLIVAGSDSSGGAGIARDIETVAACGLRSCLAVTAVTVQTHERVERIERVAPENVAAQMRAALAANDVAAIKIGMLGAGGAVEAVAAVLRDHAAVPVVLDPVIAASSGRALLPAMRWTSCAGN